MILCSLIAEIDVAFWRLGPRLFCIWWQEFLREGRCWSTSKQARFSFPWLGVGLSHFTVHSHFPLFVWPLLFTFTTNEGGRCVKGGCVEWRLAELQQCNAGGGIKMMDSLFEMLSKIMLCFSEVCLLDSYISLPPTFHCHLPQSSYLRHIPSKFPALVFLLCHCTVPLRCYLW